MSDWCHQPLALLTTFQKGRKVETSEHPREGFAPYLGASAISGDIGEYGDTRIGVMASTDDVLMLWDGERSGLVGKAQYGVISSTVARLTSKGEVNSSFLYYALDAKFEWIQGRRTGTGVPHVPKDLGRILSLTFPKNKTEQHRIAEILSTLDETIKQTEALIAKYQQLKVGLMHDLFTRGVTPDRRLRPTRALAPHLYKESPLGWIPKTWEVKQLAKFVKQDITYGIVQAGPHIENGIPYVRTGDMSGDRMVRDEMLCTSPLIAASYKRSEIKAGEIVCAIRATVGKVLPVPLELDGANLTQGTARISPNAQTDFAFLLWAMRCERTQRSISLSIKGTTFNEITLGDLRKLPIAAPTDTVEQQLIGSRLEQCASALEIETMQLAKFRMQKHGLMHDLLTGQVRVLVAEPVAA